MALCFDDPAASADELWEMSLNSVLKSALLGWELEGDKDAIIQNGKWGLDGLLNILFRGMSEGLFEGKLGPLMERLEKKSVESVTRSTCEINETNA